MRRRERGLFGSRPERIDPQLPGGARKTLTSLPTAAVELGVTRRVLRRAYRAGRIVGAMSRGRLYVAVDDQARRHCQAVIDWQRSRAPNPIRRQVRAKRADRRSVMQTILAMMGIGGGR